MLLGDGQLAGADPGVLGRTVMLERRSFRVVGVMPEAASVGTLEVDGWSIQPIDPATARRQRSYFLAMIGRLRRGVTLEAANRDLAAIMRVAADRYPASNTLANGSPLSARAESFRERLTGPARPVFLLLIGGAGLVLLVAALNLAGLQLARQIARRQELAMRRALEALPQRPAALLIDGNAAPDFGLPTETIVDGDAHVACISAASIIAKVERDRMMIELCARHPGYAFSKHKGYGTPEHQEALARLGPCAIHRLSFKPVRTALEARAA